MKRFEVTVFLVEVSDKFIQMSLQIVISIFEQSQLCFRGS